MLRKHQCVPVQSSLRKIIYCKICKKVLQLSKEEQQ